MQRHLHKYMLRSLYLCHPDNNYARRDVSLQVADVGFSTNFALDVGEDVEMAIQRLVCISDRRGPTHNKDYMQLQAANWDPARARYHRLS